MKSGPQAAAAALSMGSISGILIGGYDVAYKTRVKGALAKAEFLLPHGFVGYSAGRKVYGIALVPHGKAVVQVQMLLYVLLGKVAVIASVVSDYVPYLLGYGILRGVKAGYGGKALLIAVGVHDDKMAGVLGFAVLKEGHRSR